MKNLPTQKLRKRIICNQIKYALLKERNDPFLSQTAEVFEALEKYGSRDGNKVIGKRTWESWFCGDGPLQTGKVEKFQSILDCKPPLDIWIDVDWLFSNHSDFEKWLRPTETSSSLLLHLAAIDALGWYLGVPKQGEGSWMHEKERMGNNLLTRLHKRWKLDFNSRVGLRNTHTPCVDAAKKIGCFAKEEIVPSEQILSWVANLYEPLSPVSLQNFLFNLPCGLDIVDHGAMDEWSLDLVTVTAAHTALLLALGQHFYVGQNLSESRTLIDGLIRIFWKDDCTNEKFNDFFVWTLQLDDDVNNRNLLTMLHAARVSYQKQMAELGINYSDIYEVWTEFQNKNLITFPAR